MNTKKNSNNFSELVELESGLLLGQFIMIDYVFLYMKGATPLLKGHLSNL